MKLKQWVTNRPSVSIALCVARKIRNNIPPEQVGETWVVVQMAGTRAGAYWCGSGVKGGARWTANPDRACLYPSRTVALRDAGQMNPRHMKLRYEAQQLG
jgi:hypothetical protein